MAQNSNILQELNELNSSLATRTLPNPYIVPVGYFEHLIEQVMNRIRAMEAINAADETDFLSPTLNNVSRQMPYAVPHGYFEELAERALQSIRESNDYQTAKEEIESLSPLLSGLKKQNPYSIPEGYFEQLGAAPMKHEVKVVSITHRRWFKYAVAAVVTGIIVLTGIFIIVNKNTTNQGQSLAKFDKDLNKEIKKMSDKELNDFIQYTDAGLNGEEKVSNNLNEEVKELLKDVPDAELKQFLEETSDTETGSTMMN